MSKTATAIAKLEAKLADARAIIAEGETKLAELQRVRAVEVEDARVAELRDVTGYAVGTQIVVDYGRGSTREELTGTVRGFRPKTGTLPAAYRVEVGDGMDAAILTVLASNVKAAV